MQGPDWYTAPRLTKHQMRHALRDLASRGWVLVDTVVAAFQVADEAKRAGQVAVIEKATRGYKVVVLGKTEKPE